MLDLAKHLNLKVWSGEWSWSLLFVLPLLYDEVCIHDKLKNCYTSAQRVIVKQFNKMPIALNHCESLSLV